jgi:hypothetical protein
MIDISQYRLLTPANSTLNVKSELVVYYRNGDIISYKDNNKLEVDLTEIAGTQNEDFNLVFFNRSDEFIKDCKKSEDWLQALYAIFNFEANNNWVEVQQLSKFEFLDTVYNSQEEDIEVEESTIII